MLLRLKQDLFKYSNKLALMTIKDINTFFEYFNFNGDINSEYSCDFKNFLKSDIFLKLDEKYLDIYAKKNKVIKVLHNNDFFWIYEDELEEV